VIRDPNFLAAILIIVTRKYDYKFYLLSSINLFLVTMFLFVFLAVSGNAAPAPNIGVSAIYSYRCLNTLKQPHGGCW